MYISYVYVYNIMYILAFNMFRIAIRFAPPLPFPLRSHFFKLLLTKNTQLLPVTYLLKLSLC